MIVPWPPADIDGEPAGGGPVTETHWLVCGCAVNHPAGVGHIGTHPAPPVWTYGQHCPMGHRDKHADPPPPETHMGYRGETCPCCGIFIPDSRFREHVWDCAAELKSERDSLFARLTALEAS